MKKVLGVIGISLIVGVAAYLLLYNKKKEEHNVSADSKKSENQKGFTNDISLTKSEISQDDEPGYEEVKSSAIGDMYARHEGAACIIKESVNAIRENVIISEDTNNDIDQVSTELDKMLGEY